MSAKTNGSNKNAFVRSNKSRKTMTVPPRSGRYSRSEGAGPGPQRKHHNAPK